MGEVVHGKGRREGSGSGHVGQVQKIKQVTLGYVKHKGEDEERRFREWSCMSDVEDQAGHVGLCESLR